MFWHSSACPNVTSSVFSYHQNIHIYLFIVACRGKLGKQHDGGYGCLLVLVVDLIY